MEEEIKEGKKEEREENKEREIKESCKRGEDFHAWLILGMHAHVGAILIPR